MQVGSQKVIEWNNMMRSGLGYSDTGLLVGKTPEKNAVSCVDFHSMVSRWRIPGPKYSTRNKTSRFKESRNGLCLDILY